MSIDRIILTETSDNTRFLQTTIREVKRTVIRRTMPSLWSIAAVPGAVLVVSLLAGCAGTGGAVREKTSQEWYDQGGRLAAAGKHDDALQAFREASKSYRGADLDADIQIALA